MPPPPPPDPYAKWNPPIPPTPAPETWPEDLSTIRVQRDRFSRVNEEHKWTVTLSLKGITGPMPAFASGFVRNFLAKGTKAELGWDREIPRTEDSCGFVLRRHVHSDVYQQIRISFQRTGQSVDAIMAQDLILARMLKLGVMRLPLRIAVSAVWILLLAPALQFLAISTAVIAWSLLCILGFILTYSFLLYKRIEPTYVKEKLGLILKLNGEVILLVILGVIMSAVFADMAGLGSLISIFVLGYSAFHFALSPLVTWVAIDLPPAFTGFEHNLTGFRNAVVDSLPVKGKR